MDRISGRYEYPATPGVVFDKKDPASKSITQQHFAEDVDVNNIVAKFVKTGVLGDPVAIANRQASFGDFSNVGDFQSCLNRVVKAQVAFDALPADIRSKFDNDPAKLISFVLDKNNLKESVDLGLLPKELLPKEPVSVVPEAIQPKV